jgi:hypothetical protein
MLLYLPGGIMNKRDPETNLIKTYNILRKKSSRKSDKLDALEYYKDLIKYLDKNIDTLDEEELHLVKNSLLVYDGLIKGISLKGTYPNTLKSGIDLKAEEFSSKERVKKILGKKEK